MIPWGEEMKTIAIILTVLFSLNSLARTPHPETKVETVQVEQDTQVVELHIEQAFAVSCPGGLDLEVTRRFGGQIIIDHDMQAFEIIEGLKANLSEACQEEIVEKQFNRPPVAVCLSYGKPAGRIFVRLSRSEMENGEFTVRLPFMLNLVRVDQLK